MDKNKTSMTVSRPELLLQGDDVVFRQMLNDFFAFSRSLDSARARFAEFVGLSPTQYQIVITIARHGKTEGFGVNRIADTLHLSGSFVTNEINKMVAASFVKKVVDPLDRRRVQLRLTKHGERQLAKLASFQRPVNDVLFESITPKQFEQFREILKILVDNGDRGVRLATTMGECFAAGLPVPAGMTETA